MDSWGVRLTWFDCKEMDWKNEQGNIILIHPTSLLNRC